VARESSASSRRAMGGLDPHRSSERRIGGHRNSSTGVRAPGASRKEPAGSPRKEPPSSPRNRRVVRAPPRVPSGPPLPQRTWELLLRLAAAARGFLIGLSALLTRRLPAGPSLAVRVVLIAVTLASAVLVGHFVKRHLTTAAAFAIDTIDVKGLVRVDRAELLASAGIKLGSNVFALSPDEVRARLRAHPWIIDAQVTRTLPSGFALTIKEREPVAIMLVDTCGPPGRDDDPVCDEPSLLYLISADAKMFKRVGVKDPVDLPIITGITRKRYSEDPEQRERILRDALALLAEYRAEGLWDRSPLQEIHLEPNDGFSLYVRGDDLTNVTYVRLGMPPFAAKFRRMKRVFERLAKEEARAEHVYLDNEKHPDRVAVRVR